MANRNNYTQHKHTGMNIFATILAIIILAGCTLGGLELWGTGKQKPSNWGKDDSVAIVQPDDPGQNNEQEQPHEDASESHGVKLMAAKIPIEMYESYGIAPASVESAYTITATIEPDNATVKDVDWSVYFKNDASEWATGKTVTDYIRISPTEAQCLVTCAQAFGEPIMVKVESRADSSIFATKQFDYVKRLSKDITIAFTTNPQSPGFGPVQIGTNNLSMIKCVSLNHFYNSVGTVEGVVSVSQVVFNFKDSPLLQEIKNQFILDINTYPGLASSNYTLNYNENDYIISNPEIAGNGVIPWTAFFTVDGSNNFNKVPEKAKDILKSAVIKAVEKVNSSAQYTLLGSAMATIKNTYNKTLVEQTEKSIAYQGADCSSLVVNITDLHFEDDGGLYF